MSNIGSLPGSFKHTKLASVSDKKVTVLGSPEHTPLL